MTYHPDGRMDGEDRPASHRGASASKGSTSSALARFADTYGWRAYAIPVLAVVTALLIWSIVNTPAGETVGDTSRAPQGAMGHNGGQGATVPDMPEGSVALTELPPGGPFTEEGKGTFRPVGELGMSVGEGQEKVVRFSTEVEDRVDTSSFGGDDSFAALVDATLADPRGWTNDPKFRFEHVSASDNPDLRIQLTSVGTTREACGNDLGLETSCRLFTEKDGDRVLINESRWVRGAAPYNGDLGMYRQYLVNHEVGHSLGYAGHEPCDGDGKLAPIMMQQTLSLNNKELFQLAPEEVYPDNSDTCSANPWPYPRPTV